MLRKVFVGKKKLEFNYCDHMKRKPKEKLSKTNFESLAITREETIAARKSISCARHAVARDMPVI